MVILMSDYVTRLSNTIKASKSYSVNSSFPLKAADSNPDIDPVIMVIENFLFDHIIINGQYVI